MAKDERVELLRKVHLFASCTDKQLSFIATQVEDVDVDGGKVLCVEGSSGGDFFVVVTGTAKVERGGKVVDQLGPGAFFGEIALIDQGPRTATVTTTSPMRLIVLGPAQFRDVLHADPDMARQLLVAVTKRLRAISAPPAD
jgi:CRP-like cAMP-binding protein